MSINLLTCLKALNVSSNEILHSSEGMHGCGGLRVAADIRGVSSTSYGFATRVVLGKDRASRLKVVIVRVSTRYVPHLPDKKQILSAVLRFATEITWEIGHWKNLIPQGRHIFAFVFRTPLSFWGHFGVLVDEWTVISAEVQNQL